jgi:LAO/AO transport system kinase
VLGTLVRRMLDGDRQALARLLTLLEREPGSIPAAMRAVQPRTGHAYVVGVTGPPGAGKSTLVNGLIEELRRRGPRVGVLAVDPSSRATGGAVLGDRVRMKGHEGDAGVFIRSVATRGASGGLSRVAGAAVRLLDAFGFEMVLVETVGVGQTELDVAGAADTVVVVLVPEAGDAVQVMKAGLMEIGDVFVVNKADREGADRMVEAVTLELEARPQGLAHPSPHVPPKAGHGPLPQGERRQSTTQWRPVVVRTEGHRRAGVPELLGAIERHREAQEASGVLAVRRAARRRREFAEAVRAALESAVAGLDLAGGDAAETAARVERGELDPYTAAAMALSDPKLAERLHNALRRQTGL